MMPLALFALAGCVTAAPGRDQILAGDLAAAAPAFAALPAETPLGTAPVPGFTRVFRLPELARLAARFHLPDAPGTEVCVTRPAAPLDRALLLEAMQTSFPGARIEILDYSRQPAPLGPVQFPARALRPETGGGFWPGWVGYGAAQRFSIWAHVQVWVKVAQVLALTDLAPGRAIEAAQVQAGENEAFPWLSGFAAAQEAVVGQWPRMAIRAGAPIRLDQLQPPQLVLKGQTVEVTVTSGGAQLKLEAEAEASGALGAAIQVRNTTTQHRFVAHVAGAGAVTVETAGGQWSP